MLERNAMISTDVYRHFNFLFEVKFDIDDGNAFIEGGLIKAGLKYELVQINFHWGNSTHPGSEHTVDGFR